MQSRFVCLCGLCVLTVTICPVRWWCHCFSSVDYSSLKGSKETKNLLTILWETTSSFSGSSVHFSFFGKLCKTLAYNFTLRGCRGDFSSSYGRQLFTLMLWIGVWTWGPSSLCTKVTQRHEKPLKVKEGRLPNDHNRSEREVMNQVMSKLAVTPRVVAPFVHQLNLLHEL